MGAGIEYLRSKDPGLPDRVRKSRKFEDFHRSLRVRPEEGGLAIPMQMYPGQRRVYEETCGRDKVLILKGRRLGITTLYLARMMHAIQTRPGISCLMTAHRSEDSLKIFRSANLMYKELPRGMQHQRSRSVRREIDLQVMNSMISIGTAGGAGAGRSDALQFTHMTEAARYRGDVDQFISGVLEATRRGIVAAETTGCGPSGWFYETWEANYQKPDAAWHCVFAPWWWDHRNVKPLTEEQRAAWTLTEEEAEWVLPNQLTPEQVNWYRNKGRSLKTRVLWQEYPCFPQQAFAGTGMHFFDQVNVVRHAAGQRPRIDLGQLMVPEGLSSARRALAVWQGPQEGVKYSIGADPADGTPQGSYSYASVHRNDTKEQVARLRWRWGPKEFAKYCDALGKWYNKALIVGELNRREFIRALVNDFKYRNLYRRRNADGSMAPEPGFWTDRPHRDQALDYMSDGFEGCGEEPPWLRLNDPWILSEMSWFEDQGGGKYAAPSSAEKTDDGILAIAIGLQGMLHPTPMGGWVN